MLGRCNGGARPLVLAAASLLLSLSGCEEKPAKLSVGSKAAGPCDVKLDGLAGTEWVIKKINPDKTEVPDHAARLKLFDEGGKLRAKYNVMSVGAMYTYDCAPHGGGLRCLEPTKAKDYCQALVAGKAECTPETLRAMAPDLTDAEIEEGMKLANEVIAKFKGGPDWKKFEFNNNNLGNKLRGIIYLKVNERECNLRLTDAYMTIYDGKRVEDTNPVGTNSFVKNSLGELLWDECKDTTMLVPQGAEGFPAELTKVQPVIVHPPGSTVHYYLLDPAMQTKAEGCTYSYRTWLAGKPLASGLSPTEVAGPAGSRLEWHVAHTFSEPSVTGEGDVLGLQSTVACPGKPDDTKVYCAQIMVK